MDILDLRCFLKLVEEGSVTKAASVMHMSQPNLSRHLLRLEDELGAPLYTRDAKHARLTDAGRKLFDYATAVVGLVDEAAIEVGKEGTDPSGQVHIGFGDAEAISYILDAIAALRARHPNVVFHLSAGSSLTLLSRLNAGQLDFVFEVEHIRRVEYNELVLPGADVWGVYPLPGSRLATLDVIEPADLAGEPIIVSRQILKSGILKNWAGEFYSALTPVVTMDVFPSDWRRLVRAQVGHMIGYLYFQNAEKARVAGGEMAGASETPAGADTPRALESELGTRGIPLKPPVESGNALIWRKDRALSRAAQAFLDELRAIITPPTAE